AEPPPTAAPVPDAALEQRLAALERRLAALEEAPRAIVAAPPVPGSDTSGADAEQDRRLPLDAELAAIDAAKTPSDVARTLLTLGESRYMSFDDPVIKHAAQVGPAI